MATGSLDSECFSSRGIEVSGAHSLLPKDSRSISADESWGRKWEKIQWIQMKDITVKIGGKFVPKMTNKNIVYEF